MDGRRKTDKLRTLTDARSEVLATLSRGDTAAMFIEDYVESRNDTAKRAMLREMLRTWLRTAQTPATKVQVFRKDEVLDAKTSVNSRVGVEKTKIDRVIYDVGRDDQLTIGYYQDLK